MYYFKCELIFTRNTNRLVPSPGGKNHYGGKAVINAMQFKEMNGIALSTDERRVLERAQTYVAMIILVAKFMQLFEYVSMILLTEHKR